MNSGIYKITHIDTGRIYIGQSINLKNRENSHKYGTVKKTCRLGNAIKKHGWDAFKFEVLVYAENKDYLNYLETEIIKQYNCLSPNGFNLRTGGNSSLHSEETKAKLSLLKKKAIENGTCPKPKNMTGFKHSEETIAHLKNVHKGRVFSEETKQKLREQAIMRWKNPEYRTKVLTAKGIS